ncbi:MAG: cell division protein FtsL [Hyphomicrobiaceae bacterium]|nr:cell division protein FtsL [Hyphomicrobiaceae bacterium]
MRTLMIAAVLTTLGAAYGLYATNLHTRRIEALVQAREAALAKAKADIATLKAERAHLARPARIAPYARALGLEPGRQAQFEVGASATSVQTAAAVPPADQRTP